MSDPLLESYEAVWYTSKPIALAAPDTMAARVILHGMNPAPPDRCRVLELGCAAGGNLISMAFASPKSRFVGIDFAPTQITAGQLAISEMGLQNITLQVRSIDEIDDTFGQFEYIICHGVYSWVPPNIQEAILRVCSRNLSENGVAYVSYNTYPGWHHRGMVRDMLLFHDDPTLPPAERIARARHLTNFLASADPDNDSAHAVAVREETARLQRQTDHHLFHEQLEPHNEPVYFVEFARRASVYGLQYVAEAKESPDTRDTPRARAAFGDAHDVVRTEQYLDFLRGRTFRRTLLCHETLEVAPEPIGEALERLYVRSQSVPVTPDKADAERVPGLGAFRTQSNVTITTNNPLFLTALQVLADASPTAVAFSDFRQQVADRLRRSPDEDARTLADDLAGITTMALKCASNGLLEFRSLPSRFVARPGNRPKASALARWQAGFTDSVSSLGHWAVPLSGIEQFLLPHLDGTNDRLQLVRLTEGGLARGDLTVGGVTLTREDLTRVLDEALDRLARAALLVS